MRENGRLVRAVKHCAKRLCKGKYDKVLDINLNFLNINLTIHLSFDVCKMSLITVKSLFIETNIVFSRTSSLYLRRDNTRQSVVCTTLLYSLVMCCRAPYYIPNESLYFCLSNHINEIMIKLIFWKLWILNQSFNFSL